MANINKIRLSGQTYNIEDSNAPKTVELTQAQYDALAVKDPNTFYIITDAQGADLSQYYTSAQTESAITQAVSGKQDTLVSGTNIKTINNESLLGSGNIDIQGGGSSYTAGDGIDITNDVISVTGKVDTSTFNTYTAATDIAINSKASQSDLSTLSGTVTAHTANTDIHVTTAQTAAWNAKSDFSGSYNDLTNKPSIPSKTSDLTNDSDFATSGYVDSVVSGKANSSDVYTKSQTSGATEIATALSGKQDTLSAGTNITIVDNVISAEGGGGKAITAGRGISVTTGETADTVSFNLPISAGTRTTNLIIGDTSNISIGNRSIATGYQTKAQQSNAFAQGYKTDAGQENSHAEGYETKAYGVNSHSEGRGTSAMTICSHTEGSRTIATNANEHASGTYNVSNKASTTFGDSGNTLFSVGNGTADNARHNAFEIRQNGDIYLTKDGQDVKLQDQLGGGGSSYTAGDGIDITNDVISVKQISGDTTFVDATSTLENETSVTISTSAIIVTMKEGAVANGVTFTDNNGRILTVENNGSSLDVLGNTSYFNYSTDGYTITASTLASGDTFISISNESGNQLESLVEYFAILATTYSLQDFADNVYGKFSGKVDTSAITTSVTSSSTDSQVPSAKAVYDQLGGMKIVKLTESEYTALVTKDSNTLYVVVPDPSN